MILTPSAEAAWLGLVLEGSGKVAAKSKVLENSSYSFVSRTSENIPNQTNPEELIAAAHSSCCSMYLSLLLTQKGYKSNTLKLRQQLRYAYDDLAMKKSIWMYMLLYRE